MPQALINTAMFYIKICSNRDSVMTLAVSYKIWQNIGQGLFYINMTHVKE